jgi:hypothetical protein
MTSPTTIEAACPQFELMEFNPVRFFRGTAAARVRVVDGDDDYWLWMSRRDIQRNIKLYGQAPGLVSALTAYKDKA